jgi:hypothetical protein
MGRVPDTLTSKDNVRQEVRVGVGHVLSRLRGLGGFYSKSSPTACAMGYDLSPASRAAKRMSVSQRLGGEMPASHFSSSF